MLAAEDGPHALALNETDLLSIKLLVNDVITPQMSGPELYKKLTVYYPDLQVIYVSGYTGDTIAQHGILQERVNFLQKPFKPEDLLNKIRLVLDVRRSG